MLLLRPGKKKEEYAAANAYPFTSEVEGSGDQESTGTL